MMIAGAAMPLVIGAAGLATDTIQWALWKRQASARGGFGGFRRRLRQSAGDLGDERGRGRHLSQQQDRDQHSRPAIRKSLTRPRPIGRTACRSRWRCRRASAFLRCSCRLLRRLPRREPRRWSTTANIACGRAARAMGPGSPSRAIRLPNLGCDAISNSRRQPVGGPERRQLQLYRGHRRGGGLDAEHDHRRDDAEAQSLAARRPIREPIFDRRSAGDAVQDIHAAAIESRYGRQSELSFEPRLLQLVFAEWQQYLHPRSGRLLYRQRQLQPQRPGHADRHRGDDHPDRYGSRRDRDQRHVDGQFDRADDGPLRRTCCSSSRPTRP